MDGSREHEGSSFMAERKGTGRFFVLSENDIKSNINIRQQSFRDNLQENLEEKLLIKPKAFQILENYTKPWYSASATDATRKHRLGIFNIATLVQNGQTTKVLCRTINFERMTSYILEDYFAEVGRLKKIKMKNYIVSPLGYSTKDNTLMLF